MTASGTAVAALTAADRTALDASATSESGQWRVRDRGIQMTTTGRGTVAVALQTLRRPAAERGLPPPRLRFDRVALRVCAELRAAGASLVPAGHVGFVTIRAPIRMAAKTIAAIIATLPTTRPRRPRSCLVEGNHVRLGTLAAPRWARAHLVCFVHTHDGDAERLLAMTRDILALAESTGPAASTSLLVRTPERGASLAVYRHIHEQLAITLPYRRVFMSFGDGLSGRID